MTENEAINIAEQYAKTRGIRYARLGSTRHITVDLLDYLRVSATQKRSHWAVNFISDCPSGVVQCPAGPMILVYDDTGEAEFFPVL